MSITVRFVLLACVVVYFSQARDILAQTQMDGKKGDEPGLVIGTFDSRAVATAYMRSDKFNATMNELKRDYRDAKAAGDRERATELEKKGMTMQNLGHRQAFGDAPIPNVLTEIEDELADVAEQAGVDVMISKWRIAYEGPNAKYIDVTDKLVLLFDPDDETLDVIEQLKAIDPIPADQLNSHDHQ